MLKNKKLCKICIKTFRKGGWEKLDDMWWRDGITFCPNLKLSDDLSVPDYCLFKLEYLLEKNNVK